MSLAETPFKQISALSANLIEREYEVKYSSPAQIYRVKQYVLASQELLLYQQINKIDDSLHLYPKNLSKKAVIFVLPILLLIFPYVWNHSKYHYKSGTYEVLLPWSYLAFHRLLSFVRFLTRLYSLHVRAVIL